MAIKSAILPCVFIGIFVTKIVHFDVHRIEFIPLFHDFLFPFPTFQFFEQKNDARKHNCNKPYFG